MQGKHSQLPPRREEIQVAIALIGRQLGYRTYVAHNDKDTVYDNKRLAEMSEFVAQLENEALIAPHRGAVQAAPLIDCIWFHNDKFTPAIIEIEHTTGVIAGLTRMKSLQDSLPPFLTRWVLAAPDDARELVIKEANKPMFRSLRAYFFAYSAVEELRSLCQRRGLCQRHVKEQFLDHFMEPCLSPFGRQSGLIDLLNGI